MQAIYMARKSKRTRALVRDWLRKRCALRVLMSLRCRLNQEKDCEPGVILSTESHTVDAEIWKARGGTKEPGWMECMVYEEA